MPSRALANCLAVHIRFPYSVNSMTNLRFIYHQFQSLGNLVHWTDYFSKAGHAHHSSRSMAVFMIDSTLDGNAKWEKVRLEDELRRIVGISLYSDYRKLQDGEVREISPVFSKARNYRQNTIDARVSHATLEDPFFKIVGDQVSNNDIRLDKRHGIPMVIKVQDLS